MEIMIEFIVILLVIIIILIPFLFPFVYDSDWFENYFWEDKELFQKIMNYIKINRYKFEIKSDDKIGIKSDDKIGIELGKVKVSQSLSYGRLGYNVYFNDKNISYLLNERQNKYICNYVYKIYIRNEKMKVLHEII